MWTSTETIPKRTEAVRSDLPLRGRQPPSPALGRDSWAGRGVGAAGGPQAGGDARCWCGEAGGRLTPGRGPEGQGSIFDFRWPVLVWKWEQI